MSYYRVSISESTMERLREYAKKCDACWGVRGVVGSAGRSITVENVIVVMLQKEGF